MERSGYANGKSFIETDSRPEGEYTRTIDYLLDNGRRHKVALDMSVDSPELRHRIGLALATGRRGITK